MRIRHASDLVRQATIVPSPSAQDGYPGASLDTWYVCRLARYCVAEVLQCDPLLMIGKPRGARQMAEARRLAMHLAHIVAGRPLEDVADAFSRNRSTSSHHFGVVENLRQVGEYNDFLEQLEARFAHLLRAAEIRPAEAWGRALKALDRAVRRASMDDADAHFDAKFVVDTFRVRAKAKR